MNRSPSILVIGAGMAGMACARTLIEQGRQVTVLEASDRVGGRLGSEQVDGNWLDLGFQVSMSNYRALESLVPRSVIPRHSFIPGALVWTGRSHVRMLDPRRAPLSSFHSLMSGLVGLQDLRGAVRCRRWASQVDGEPRTGTANDILQAAGFSRRFQNAFLRPFFGGVFLDENLDVSADRFLRTLNGFATGHAELPTGGMQQLAEGMADPIRDHIQCNRTVTDIQPGHGVTCADGETIEAEHIILATEVDQTMRLLGTPPEPEASIWSSTIACHFSSPSMIMRQPLIALNGSGTGIINLICSPTAVAPGYRSDDMHSIIVSLKPFVGPAPTVDAETVATEAATMLGVDTSSWTWIRNSVITKGLPAFNRVHPPSNPPSGIWLTGDWTGDPSIETAVSSGISTAERVLSS